MLPHAGWWALKSPSRMTSPTASPKAVSSAVHALILGLLPLGLYTLIIDTVILHSKSWSTATYGPCCLWGHAVCGAMLFVGPVGSIDLLAYHKADMCQWKCFV